MRGPDCGQLSTLWLHQIHLQGDAFLDEIQTIQHLSPFSPRLFCWWGFPWLPCSAPRERLVITVGSGVCSCLKKQYYIHFFKLLGTSNFNSFTSGDKIPLWWRSSLLLISMASSMPSIVFTWNGVGEGCHLPSGLNCKTHQRVNPHDLEWRGSKELGDNTA